ncbi:MAG: TolC family protein, partial [Anaerolineae bacterium]
MQATFEEIGIAQADLVEAGLFTNPFFDAYIRFPDRSSANLNTQFSIATSFLDIILIPLRKKTAKLQFDQVKMRVANVILSFAAQVEQTFFSLQAALTKAELQRMLIEAAAAAAALAEKQLKVGNINDLAFEVKTMDFQQSQMELEQTEIEIISLIEKLSILMGVKCKNWQILSSLPSLPDAEVSSKDLEALALTERLDVAAMRKEVEVITSIGAQKKWWSYTNGRIGISSEREADGVRETGPVFGLSIPLFNYGQADRARLLAQLRQSQAKLKALELEVKAQVKAAQEKLLRSRKIVEHYAYLMLPLAKKIVDSSQVQYNIMAYGVYDLLRNKREELRAQINYGMALRDYWAARSALELIVGGKLKNKPT